LELVADYAAMLKRVAQNGARDAIDAWLATYKD
jgi:hypothetical protein